MLISDLNYLEVVNQETGIVGSGGVTFDNKITKNVDLNKKVNLDIKKKVDIFVDIKGNLADLELSADATGDNTLAEIAGFTQAEKGYSAAYGQSTSAVY